VQRVPVAKTAFSGRASKIVGFVPRRLRGPIAEAGGMVDLLGKILWSATRHPLGYWRAVVDDLYLTLRRSWLPIAAALFGFCICLSVLAVQFFSIVGGTQLFGPMLLLTSMRTFTLWINSMVVAGVIGTTLTADLGARKVREELDAMEVMGIDPIRDLVVPRVVSITLFTALLSMPSLLVTVISMQVGASFVASQPAGHFYSNLFSNTSGVDVIAVVVNSLLVGVLIGTVCCYKGLNASGGSIGLGRAVNQAVVISFLSIWVLQLAFNALLLALVPGLGQFR
jgi:phospholipid/cholesterol/gamma-HCH transport system permease protein